MSRQLRTIISGELVLTAPNKYGRRDATLSDNPQPIKGATRWAYDLKTGRIVRRTTPLPEPTLPSFKDAIAKFFDTPAESDE